MTFRPRDPPKSAQVLEYLTAADDFCSTEQIAGHLPITKQQVQCSLHYLYHRKAVNCMPSDGRLYWYATPDTDDRSKTLAAVKERQMRPGQHRNYPKVKRNWLKDGPPPRGRK